MLSIGSSGHTTIGRPMGDMLISRVWFRPRILRDVSTVDFSTKILGFDSSMPIYITATALGELNPSNLR